MKKCISFCWMGLGLFAFWSSAVQASPLQQAARHLEQWKDWEAAELLLPLQKKYSSSRDYHFLLGKLFYYQSKHQKAVFHYKKAIGKKAWKAFSKKDSTIHSLLATQKITKNNLVVQSAHFSVSVRKGTNEILVPYLLEALEKAYQRIGKIFQYYPPKRVHVQILDYAEQLAEMSPLTENDIERTGTIALCKYNRIMLTSPGALLRGYRWLDTAVHEYVHLVINRSAPRIPIWLHEGLARYAEILWRENKPSRLSPYSETLLARALKKKSLITFKQMHPSMAKLPSQQDAAQAYAQVYTVILYLVRKYRQKAIPETLSWVAKGLSVPKAFEKVTHLPFVTFLKHWKKDLKKQNLKEYKDILPEKKILKSKRNQQKSIARKTKEEEKDFWSKPTSKKELGERYFRLAEMLRSRGRWNAAYQEYSKAEKYWKNKKPMLQNKMALALLQTKKYQKVIPTIEYSLKDDPHHVTSYYRLGKAYWGLNNPAKAREAFETVNQINPFHPGVHLYLRRIYRLLKEKKLAQRERKISRLLRN